MAIGTGRLITGAVMVLFVIITNLLIGFIRDGATDTQFPTGCSSSDDNATCEVVGKTTFLHAILSVVYTPIEGAPAIINAAWGIAIGFLLAVGTLLIVLAFVPLTNA